MIAPMSLPPRFAKQGSSYNQRYSELSKQPLYILVFLLPLIIFYEIALYSSDSNIQIKAHDHLVRFFERFDMPPTQGLWLGGIVIATTLLLWHIFTTNRWAVRLSVIAFMALESVLFALPCFFLVQCWAVSPCLLRATQIGQLGLFEKLAVSIGAGLYEELVFRMIIIACVHTIVCNVFKQSNIAGLSGGVIVSAVLFALYHDLPTAGSLETLSLFFFSIAGIYLGILYVSRGFGIAAATHAAYDVVATSILASVAA